jgi:hypothetical protein
MPPPLAPRAAPDGTGNGSQGDHLGKAVTSDNNEAVVSSQPVIIAQWRRNSRERVRVTLDEYQGHRTIDVRTWFQSDHGELKPTRTGITIGIKHLPRLARALADALAKARELGLVIEVDDEAPP